MKKEFMTSTQRKIHYDYLNNQMKETILFIHGAGSNMKQFEAHTSDFSTKFNVLNVTLFGHDPSQKDEIFKNEDFNLKKLAYDVNQLITDLKLENLHIVGNSAGGLVGFELIKSIPSRILSITTFGTAPRLMVSKWMIKLITKIDHQMLKKNANKYLTFAAKASSKNRETIKNITCIMLESKHAAPLIRSQIGRYDYIEFIKNSKTPYLLLTGDQDKSINKALKPYQEIFRKNQMISEKHIESSGHFLNMDQKDTFNQLVLSFIDQLKR
jgi:3-oxoadipate enol-lactonase